jgi:predicted aspartyl protease
MGYVYIDVVVRGSKASKSVKMLVDTGATYAVLDAKLVEELGLTKLPYDVEPTLANGSKVKARLHVGEVEVKGRRGPAFIAALSTPIPLLGVNALETLGLKPNPQTGDLEIIGPEGGYLL